ncbi:MAG: methyltransferase domain-containing protein, partial [Bacteroidales bacterium]|nr:methyltransferase domain-containing protein [Bacteroidales bacterium]
MSHIVQKLSDQSFIDLDTLSVEELDRLHFDEESWCAREARLLRPFSIDRNGLLAKGYSFVNTIMDVKAFKLKQNITSRGASKKIIPLLKKLIYQLKNKYHNNSVNFFEAGIGKGMIISSLANEVGVNIYGCDFCIEKEIKNNTDFTLFEGTIIDGLNKTPDSSIDLFYWDNVLEHIPEDEVDETIKLIYQKVRRHGFIVTVVPNPLLGPHDITKLFYPKGTK